MFILWPVARNYQNLTQISPKCTKENEFSYKNLRDDVFEYYLKYEGIFMIRGEYMIEKLYFLPLSRKGEFLTHILNATTSYVGNFSDIDVKLIVSSFESCIVCSD